MARPMTPDEFDELLAAYALDAIDDDDRPAVDERLASDPEARQRLAQLEEAVMLAAHELGPPDHVWDRLAADVFPGQPRVPHPRLLVNRANTRRPGRRILAGLAAAACIAALGTGIVLASTAGPPNPSLTAAAQAAQGAPGARLADLRATDGTVAASAVVLPNGSGYLTSQLSGLATGRTFQLWALTTNGAVSLGVLGPHPQVVAFTLVGGARRLVVTDEAAGGVTESHQVPTAVGDLPSA
jgi:anti-sigma factor RsiW